LLLLPVVFGADWLVVVGDFDFSEGADWAFWADGVEFREEEAGRKTPMAPPNLSSADLNWYDFAPRRVDYFSVGHSGIARTRRFPTSG